MAATDRPTRRGPVLALPVLLVGVVGLALAVGAALRPDVPGLPAAPETGRDDVTLAVDVAVDEHDRLVVELDVGVSRDAAALTVVDWPRGNGPGGDDWTPAVHAERLPAGQIVLHVGTGGLPRDDDVYEYETPTPEERTIRPGERLRGTAHLDPELTAGEGDPFSSISRRDLDAVDEVRVCLWEAGAEPAPGARPATCADADL